MKILRRSADKTSESVEALEHDSASRPVLSEPIAADSGLVAEWQQRGFETFSGNAFRKLRLTLAPTPSAITAGATG